MLYGIIALAVLLCLCGGALIWTINKNTRTMVLNDELERQLEDVCSAKKQLENENYRLNTENTRLQTMLQAQHQHMQERLQDIENIVTIGYGNNTVQASNEEVVITTF